MNYLKAFAIVFVAGIATCAAFQCLLQKAARHDRRLW